MMDHLALVAIRCVATLVLLLVGARRSDAGPTLETQTNHTDLDLLPMMDVLNHRSEDLRNPAPSYGNSILNQVDWNPIMDLDAVDNRFPPLYSQGLILGSLIATRADPLDSPLNSQGLTLNAILNAVPTGHPSLGGLSQSLAGSAAWNIVNAAAGGSQGHPSLAIDNRPPPFDMSRARESAVLFLALVCILLPMILALFGLGERDRWILLSIKILSIFVILVFICAYSYRNYHPSWHPILEALMLINLASGLGCLGAGACAREQAA